MSAPDERQDDATRDHWYRALVVDVAPLRASRDFRLLWAGNAVSSFGSHATMVAIPFQIFRLTGSALAVGLIGLVELAPILLLSVVGGAVADTVDRRKLLVWTNVGFLLCTLALAWHAASSSQSVFVVYGLALVNASLFALQRPAFRSLNPVLLPKEQLPAAAALEHAAYNTSALTGPAVAGVLLGSFGLPWAYGLDAVTFAVALSCAAGISSMPPTGDGERLSWRAMLDGIRFLRGKRVLQGSFWVDINAMVFGMPMALFPAVVALRFDDDPRALGVMYAAPAAGALVASATSGWARRVNRHGVAVYVAVVAWGVSIAVFGVSEVLLISLLALAAAGAADSISGIFRTAILQTATPVNMLGRVHGVELAVVAGGPSIGDIEAGVVASLTSVPFSIAAGGLACVVGVFVMALLLPEFARYDARDPVP